MSEAIATAFPRQAESGADRRTGPAPARVSLARLVVTDFRCYAAARLELGPEPVVLAGPNGAGKTNLLEAVSFLVPGRGLRRARLAAVARREAGEAESARVWAVAARLDTMLGTVEVGTGRDGTSEGERRLVRVDGQAARSQAALGQHASALWLTPQMDRLFLEGSAERRRFLDRLVFALDPAHAARVADYENALRQRARLLRDGPADPAWLAALEDAMATSGIAVAAARRELARRLCVATPPAGSPFPRARVAVAGTVEDWLDAMPALQAEDDLRTRLAGQRGLDRETGTTALGPHRSDMVVHDADTGLAATEGSTGQQKALLLALVLACARLQHVDRGTPPLLLLDEVAAHLDRRRRAALYDEILGLGAQAWLTGTDAELFRPLAGRAQFFRVENAVVTPERGIS